MNGGINWLFQAIVSLGNFVIYSVQPLPRILNFTGMLLHALVTPPFRFNLWLIQAEFVGFGSLFIVILTGGFTGAVFTLQSAQALSKVGMESMVGSTVLLAVARELGPVLTALMAAGRVGSAMASELGTMRVSEQIDAMEVMAVNPIAYLVVPRVIACAMMLPCLCVIFNVMAFIGSYVVAVLSMHIDEGAFLAKINWYLDFNDFVHGFFKAVIFGIVIASVGCYKGYFAEGGARGVGNATTQTVVICSIIVFVLDYLLTSVLLGTLS